MKNNKDIEILGNPEGFEVKQMITPATELLDPEMEETITEVAEELAKEEEEIMTIKKDMSDSAVSHGFQKEKEKKLKKADALRGLAREFINDKVKNPKGKNPNSVQLREMAKRISG